MDSVSKAQKGRAKMKKNWVKELGNKELLEKLLWHAEYIGACNEAKCKLPANFRKRNDQIKKEVLSRLEYRAKCLLLAKPLKKR